MMFEYFNNSLKIERQLKSRCYSAFHINIGLCLVNKKLFFKKIYQNFNIGTQQQKWIQN